MIIFKFSTPFFCVKQNLNPHELCPIHKKPGPSGKALGAAVFTAVLSALGRRKNWKPKPSTAKPPKVEHQHVGCWTKNRGILPPKWMAYNGKPWKTLLKLEDLGGKPPIFGNVVGEDVFFFARIDWLENFTKEKSAKVLCLWRSPDWPGGSPGWRNLPMSASAVKVESISVCTNSIPVNWRTS